MTYKVLSSEEVFFAGKPDIASGELQKESAARSDAERIADGVRETLQAEWIAGLDHQVVGAETPDDDPTWIDLEESKDAEDDIVVPEDLMKN